jgi:hypothetical protein
MSPICHGQQESPTSLTPKLLSAGVAIVNNLTLRHCFQTDRRITGTWCEGLRHVSAKRGEAREVKRCWYWWNMSHDRTASTTANPAAQVTVLDTEQTRFVLNTFYRPSAAYRQWQYISTIVHLHYFWSYYLPIDKIPFLQNLTYFYLL